jgi:kynureninase
VPTAERSPESYRDEFPVLARKAYLISASLGPVSERSRACLDAYLDAWATKGAPDHVWFEDIFPRMRGLKETFARLAGCRAEELAITTNISIALSTIASALDLSERRKVIMSELDFPTDGHVWLAQRRRGLEIEWLRSPDGLTIPLEEYDRAIDERTAVVMVNRVLYRSSAVVDAKEVCRIARERGALSFLDDYHGVGILPLDLHDIGCDLYTAGVLKWLCGGPGLAFLYVRRDLIPTLEPAVTGWFATAEPFSFDAQHLEYHPTARRFEHGTPPAPVFFIAQGGLDVIGEVTPERIRARQGELTDRVIARADELGLPIRTPRERHARGGVVNVGVGPEAGAICHALLDRDVCTDFRGDGLRISPHFFNTEADVDRCFEELRTLLPTTAARRA